MFSNSREFAAEVELNWGWVTGGGAQESKGGGNLNGFHHLAGLDNKVIITIVATATIQYP